MLGPVNAVGSLFPSCRYPGLDNREITHDNNGMQDATTLCVITPAAIGPQYFREAANVIDAAAGGSPERAEMAEIMRRHGLTPAPLPSSLALVSGDASE